MMGQKAIDKRSLASGMYEIKQLMERKTKA